MNAAGYIRISVSDQSVYSLENQERQIRNYCKANNLTLTGLFKDDGESSYTFDRPDWKSLEQFIVQNKNVQYLLVSDHDRLSRNLSEALLKIKELHDKYGIKVLATTDSFDTDFSDPSTFMVRAFKYMMAESELWRIRERTKSGMVQAALNGRYVSRAPYGYLNSKDSEGKPLLKIDEEKAFIVRMIFREYNKGLGIEEVRKMVSSIGFNQTGRSAIQHILGNPVYAGLIRIPAHKGKPETIGKAIHKGIVSEGDYWRAQTRLNEKKITTQKNEEVPLRGVLRCHCGKLMTAGNSKGRKKYYWYYLCNTHRESLPASKLHAQLNEILDLLSLNEKRTTWLKDKINQEIANHLNDRAAIITQTNKVLRGVNDKIASAEEKYLTDDISKTVFNTTISKLRNQQIELQKRLVELETDGQDYYSRLMVVLPKMNDLRGTFDSLDLNRQQSFLRMVFDDSLYHDGISYRTASLHPIFAHNQLELKEKGLLIIQQSLTILEKTPISAPYRNWIEPFMELADLLAA
jgi:site-specific DNA recombinase